MSEAAQPSIYRHTQVGWVIIATMAGLVALLGRRTGPLALLLVAVLWLFATLTVEVDDYHICVWFGPGLIRKRIKLADVKKAEAVQNCWWWGWGIRIYHKGIVYNVSGLAAVELEMKDGSFFRIGTDEPDSLARFITAKLEPGAAD